MKVWIVVGFWNNGDYDRPIGVYSSKERAEQAANVQGEDSYDDIEIWEYEVDRT